MIADQDQDFAEWTGTKAPRPAFPDDRHAGKTSYALQAVKRKENLKSSLFVSPATFSSSFPMSPRKKQQPTAVAFESLFLFLLFGLKAFMA